MIFIFFTKQSIAINSIELGIGKSNRTELRIDRRSQTGLNGCMNIPQGIHTIQTNTIEVSNVMHMKLYTLLKSLFCTELESYMQICAKLQTDNHQYECYLFNVALNSCVLGPMQSRNTAAFVPSWHRSWSPSFDRSFSARAVTVNTFRSDLGTYVHR